MLTIRETSITENIVKHCERIIIKSIDITETEFKTNLDLIEIICFNILQIGELAAHFEKSFISKHNMVPWDKIIGMRNVVVHGYGSIKLNKVWETLIHDIPVLCKYCKDILIDKDK